MHLNLLFILFVFFADVVFAETVTIDIKEWHVPYENSRPRDPYVAPDGRVWFCGQLDAYIGVLDPASGDFEKYDLDDNERPHNLIIDDQGIVWFAGNTLGYIGRLNPATGEIKKYPMTNDNVHDPHTLVFDSKGDIWFTAQQSNFVGKLFVKTGELKVVEVPTPRSRPYGIWMDSKDRPWIALFATNKLATVDPVSFAIKEIELPREKTLPRRLVVTSDDTVWYVDYKSGYLGQYNPGTTEIKEWLMPGKKQSGPYGMTVDDQDRIWFVETGLRPNRLIEFDSKINEFISETDIPSGGESIRHMYYHPDKQAIWFGTDSNTIGRAIVP
jgi:virginiamycin B lyase